MMTLDQKQYVFFKKTKLLLFRKIWHSSISARLQNSRFRKAGSAVSVILKCEAREPHTLAGRVPPFFHLLQPFVRIWSVARVRKKYGCFAVYSSAGLP